MDTFVYCPNILQLLVLWTVRKNKWKAISEIDCSAAHHDYWCRVLGWGLLSTFVVIKKKLKFRQKHPDFEDNRKKLFSFYNRRRFDVSCHCRWRFLYSVSPHLPDSQQYSDDWLFLVMSVIAHRSAIRMDI